MQSGSIRQDTFAPWSASRRLSGRTRISTWRFSAGVIAAEAGEGVDGGGERTAEQNTPKIIQQITRALGLNCNLNKKPTQCSILHYFRSELIKNYRETPNQTPTLFSNPNPQPKSSPERQNNLAAKKG